MVRSATGLLGNKDLILFLNIHLKSLYDSSPSFYTKIENKIKYLINKDLRRLIKQKQYRL